MKIAVIEDEKPHRDLLVAYLEDWGAKQGRATEISSFDSADSFWFSCEDRSDFDILFLDIQMEGMDGMELARRIRERNEDVAIVFATGVSDCLEEGYEVEALHYLLKPLSPEKVEQCMERVSRRRRQERFAVLNTARGIRKLSQENINYAEARGRNCCIGIVGEREPLEVRESLWELEQLLDKETFMKCHRSYLCRIGNIHHIDKEDIIFDDGSSIPVSRRLYRQVNQRFIAYFRKGESG